MQQQGNILGNAEVDREYSRADNRKYYRENHEMPRPFDPENQDDWNDINDVLGESLNEREIDDYEPEYGTAAWNARERAAYQKMWPDSDKPAPVDDDLSAWITPSGTFYHVPSCSHEAWANAWHNCNADQLESRGWVHLSFTGIHYRNRLSQAQIDILYDIMTMVMDRGENSRLAEFEKRFITKVTVIVATND